MKQENILICECNSTEHQIVVFPDPELDDSVLYCHIHLTQYGFWRRFVKGIKYIFGYKCRYGHWDEFLLSEKHIPALKEMVEYLLEEKNK